MSRASIAIVILMCIGASCATKREAHEKEEAAEAAKNAPALAVALKEARVSLVSALEASEKEGTPISGKFELEDGKLQLSVYTMKGGKFFEVVVDHHSGQIAKTEAITGGEDLEAAKEQAQAMAKTKSSLREVVREAEQANPGYQAVSVAPEIERGAAEADVVLLKGTASKRFEKKL